VHTWEKLAEKFGEQQAVAAETIRASIAAGLAETRNALRVTGARNVPVYANTPLNSGPARLVGWSLRETSGAAAQVTVYDARTADGDVLAVLNLPANGASNHGLPGPGVTATEAVYFAVSGGTVQGSLYLGAVD
jgi:hypothetical protein